jgi:hypothetical protein
MPLYDCGVPSCGECQRAFGPNRTRAIQVAIDCGKIVSPFGWVRMSAADCDKLEYAARQVAA